MYLGTPYMSNPSAHTVRRNPSAFDPMAYAYDVRMQQAAPGPYGVKDVLGAAAVGGALAGGLFGLGSLGGQLGAGAVAGAATGAAQPALGAAAATAGKIGLWTAVGGAALGALGMGVANLVVKQLRGLYLEGREFYLNEFWRSSPRYLTTPRGPRTRTATTMRQQMMQTIHNSAYSLNASIGQEAARLHR